jgi:hypothetical protein
VAGGHKKRKLDHQVEDVVSGDEVDGEEWKGIVESQDDDGAQAESSKSKTKQKKKKKVKENVVKEEDAPTFLKLEDMTFDGASLIDRSSDVIKLILPNLRKIQQMIFSRNGKNFLFVLPSNKVFSSLGSLDRRIFKKGQSR